VSLTPADDLDRIDLHVVREETSQNFVGPKLSA
jgi:hypothetical protein